MPGLIYWHLYAGTLNQSPAPMDSGADKKTVSLLRQKEYRLYFTCRRTVS